MKRSAMYRARNVLVQLGVISVRERPGKQSSLYTIHSLCLFKGHKAEHKADTKRNTKRTQGGTQSGTIYIQDNTYTPPVSPPEGGTRPKSGNYVKIVPGNDYEMHNYGNFELLMNRFD